MGSTCLAVLYLVFSVASFFSKSIVTKIGSTKLSMTIGAMCYSFWIVCFLLPAYYAQFTADNETDKLNSFLMKPNFIKAMLVITAAINGAGAGILWTAQGSYMAECACDENKGFFNSYFWSIFMSSNIVGNFIGAFSVDSGGSKATLFMIFSILSIFGSLLFCVLAKNPKKSAKEI